MAAILSTTAITRHVIGDLSIRFYTLSGNNGDTLTVNLPSILDVLITPTTDIAVGATWAAGATGVVITFATAGAWAAVVAVLSRVG